MSKYQGYKLVLSRTSVLFGSGLLFSSFDLTLTCLTTVTGLKHYILKLTRNLLYPKQEEGKRNKVRLPG